MYQQSGEHQPDRAHDAAGSGARISTTADIIYPHAGTGRRSDASAP